MPPHRFTCGINISRSDCLENPTVLVANGLNVTDAGAVDCSAPGNRPAERKQREFTATSIFPP
jgi:hypothetical protein